MSFKHTFNDNGSVSFVADGRFNVIMNGDISGGTLVVQLDGNDLSDTSRTTNEDQEVLMNGKNEYTLNLTGAGSPSLNVTITGDVG